MKTKGLSITAVLLIVGMALAACGEVSEQGSKEQTQPQGSTESTQNEAQTADSGAETGDAIIVPELFVGVWQSVLGNDVFTINSDGTVRFNDEEAEIVDAHDDYMYIELRDAQDPQRGAWDLSFRDGYISTSMNGEPAYYYPQGRENPAAVYFGTWRAYEKERPEWKGEAIRELTISDDGILRVNGEEIDYYFDYGGILQVYADEPKIFASLDQWIGKDVLRVDFMDDTQTVFYPEDMIPEDFYGVWTCVDGDADWNKKEVKDLTITPDGKILINDDELEIYFSFNSENGAFTWTTSKSGLNGRYDPNSMFIFCLNANDRRCYCGKDVTAAEITLDNWKDYFHLEIRFEANKDNEGDVSRLWAMLYLAQNEDAGLAGINDIVVKAKIAATEIALLSYDSSSDQFTKEVIAKEKWSAYSTLAGYIEREYPLKIEAHVYPQPDRTFSAYLKGEAVYGKGSNEFVTNGTITTVPSITDFDVTLTEITGTVFAENH